MCVCAREHVCIYVICMWLSGFGRLAAHADDGGLQPPGPSDPVDRDALDDFFTLEVDP